MLIKPDQRMAEICCGVLSENEAAAATVTQPSKSRRERSSSRAARRRRMEIRRIKFVSSMPSSEHTAGQDDGEQKRRRRDVATTAAVLCRVCEEEKCDHLESAKNGRTASETAKEVVVLCESLSPKIFALPDPEAYLKCGVVSVCGKRQDMEDAVAVHPFFLHPRTEYSTAGYHYCGVYDGHGCSHVAMRCRDRLHELVREELDEMDGDWEGAMERSFTRMDKEVVAWNEGEAVTANCRCELQTPDCDAVGSTAVVAVVTPDKIIVANCGDSRAVLCRSGKSIPLSSDHKPDRPDELDRIQAAGGRVIYWDGPRVLGVLAMSRAIGDNYLKPYVTCKPEVTVTERADDDDCLILASDGLWDVVSNETACGVARMCLRGKPGGGGVAQPPNHNENQVMGGGGGGSDEVSDKACTDASILLMKLALARHSSDNVSVVVVDLRRDT
ncbi:PREDICTED: probable protein phosphatase 2C 78 isoform X1 [Tarenaya hassleriana]|uniref:probable protein phosphatase 2C 78 isoform X1 n=1 Tax=Tarenaya hassleriana TaxID=28532 RepID=UPI00053CA836|nr:PREDICTED: probable protein phosphatase 2C 78 isoform X1 [Tarenaya hassleriana]